MKHMVLYKRKGFYTGWPVPSILPDGRLSVVVESSPWAEHYALGKRITLVSEDEGETWTESDEPGIPSNWPASSTREGHDRFEAILPNGRYFTVGGVGWEVWPSRNREKAEKMGLRIVTHPDPQSDQIIVGGHKVFMQWSDDKGQTWNRKEWVVPRATRFTSFPRSAYLSDGTILAPAYDIGLGSAREACVVYVIRVTDQTNCELIEIPGRGRFGDEFAVVETSPGTVLAHIRDQAGSGYLLESWSHDGGRVWSHALRTEIWGYPPHLLKLRDGRILCSYGYRREPMGVRAVLSRDGGRTWDMDNEIILRDDGVAAFGNPLGSHSPGDLGYPISVQLTDGSIFTPYYFIEEDDIVHVAATKWRPD